MGGEGQGPQWRVLYKQPLNKRTADLQWRILHGAIATNAFISVLNPDVSVQCPFCCLRETVFHVFTECKRLTVFFTLLTCVFSPFNVAFCINSFIYGAGYRRVNRVKWELLNFISGEAKMAIYISRRNKVEDKAGQEASSVWRCNVRCRLRMEFCFYKMIGDLDTFKNIWCYEDILCSVVDDKLIFAYFLCD